MELKRGFTFGLGLLLALCMVLAYAGNSIAASDDGSSDDNTITVTGTGYVYAEPDMAKIRAGVVTEANTSTEAMRENARVMDAIASAIRDQEIPDKDIQTSTISVQPVYNYDRQPRDAADKPRIVGYKATNTVTVTIRDTGKIGPVIDAAYGAGANEINGVEFMLSDDLSSRIYKEALEKAVAEGSSKAKTIASAANISSLKLIRIAESGQYQPVPQYRAFEAGKGGDMMAAAVPTPVSPGEERVQATVTMEYSFI